jgi:hypothetical protein
MHFDFSIQKINIEFETVGTGSITTKINGNIVDKEINSTQLLSDNTLEILFTKKDPSDTSSFAEIKNFLVNGGDFSDQIKEIMYYVDLEKHPDAPAQIQGNLYFGYVGKLIIDFTQRNDELAKAAWIIADNEFEYIKWPLKGENYRAKTFDAIYRDAKYMYTGSLAPADPSIISFIDKIPIGVLRNPLRTYEDRQKIEEWINRSKRITMKNFDKMNHFTYSNGVLDSLNSFIGTNKNLYMPKKMYYFYGEVLKDKETKIKDLFSEKLDYGASVLIELPSPWYETNLLLNKIKEAKEKDCIIGLDLTWLPASTESIDIDLDMVDQIFFSMNKTWPIHDIRPAFRWSKQRVNDSQTFQYEYCSYPKVGGNLFKKLINVFEFDHTYNLYHNKTKSINDTFGLDETSVLWFTTHNLYQHKSKNHISDHYFLDDFVCIRKLLDYQGKYFW